MDEKLKELSLPEWAFVDDFYKGGYILDGRTVVLHVRTATVLEIFHGDGFLLNDGVPFTWFDHINAAGLVERITIAVHYCATLDASADRQIILDEVLMPCAAWYAEVLIGEDNDVIREARAHLN